MTSPQSGSGGAEDAEGAQDDAVTTRLPTGSGTDIAGTMQPADDRRAAAAAVLDKPLDDGDLNSQVHRPGMARSTAILLALLLAVGLIALGAWIGRATAYRTGPGSMPDVVGTVESVQNGGNSGQITVRAGNGTLTVFTTTPGTKVAAATPGGLATVHTGQQVTVSSQRDRLGGTDASLIQTPTG